MCNNTAGFIALCGRVALCAIFLSSALLNKIPNFMNVVAHMEKEGVPLPRIALVITITLLIIGSIFVIIGYKARLGALMLLVFLIAATFYFHDFWNMDAESAYVQQIMFMKNLSIMGAMLLILAMGSGPWSLSDCCTPKAVCDTSPNT